MRAIFKGSSSHRQFDISCKAWPNTMKADIDVSRETLDALINFLIFFLLALILIFITLALAILFKQLVNTSSHCSGVSWSSERERQIAEKTPTRSNFL